MTRQEETKNRGVPASNVVALRPRAESELIAALGRMQSLLQTQGDACRHLRSRVVNLRLEMDGLGDSMSNYHNALSGLDVEPLRHCNRRLVQIVDTC